jgi:glucan phosphorylase
MQDTPEAALVAAQAYLLTTQPKPGDLWESMHQAAIKSLGMIRDELRQKNWWKRGQHTKNRLEKEGKSPNLSEPKDPVHPAGKITRHIGKMHGISLHKLG